MHIKTRFTLLFSLLSFVLFAFFSGGCGGSSSNVVDEGASGARYVLAGSLTTARFDGSDLTPYLRTRIKESADFSDFNNLIETFDSLKSGDIIFFGNADEDIPENLRVIDAFTLLDSITNAFNRGVTFAAVYPDSGDIEAMNEMLDLSLAYPDENAPLPFFEFTAMTKRILPNEMPNVFVYVANCNDNTDYFNSSSPASIAEDSSVSTDSGGEPQSFDSVDIEAVVPVSSADLYKELCEARIQALFDWAEGIDARVDAMSSSVEAAVQKLRNAADTKSEILNLASGVTTDYDDNFSMGFRDYYNRYMKDSSSAGNVIKRLGLSNSSVLDAYSQFSVKRATHSHYQVISVHSFEDHYDYYLVLSQANTQPKALQIRAPSGTRDGGDVKGHSSVLGFTTGLFTYIWPNLYDDNGSLVRYVPNETVNNNRTYTDTNSWSTTNGVTVSARGGYSQKMGANGELGLNYNWSQTVSHTSTTSWTGHDYEIIPQPNTDSHGRRVAKWCLDIEYPDYSYSSDSWWIATASKSSVTLNAESIFRADLNHSDSFTLYGRAGWWEGFAGTNSGQSACGLWHGGDTIKLNIIRPLHLALEGAAYEGSKEDKMYTATLYAEADWKAESNADWLMLSNSSLSGHAGSSTIRYEASENTTGRMREATITITAGRDQVYLQFTQSGGGI